MDSATSSPSPWSERLFRPVDIAWLAYFRVAFGMILTVEMLRYFALGRVRRQYVEPEFYFTYFGFEWVEPWPGIGMYIHFGVLLLAALCVTVGLFYRIAMAVFCLGFTYVFLLDMSHYLNHFYLVCLLSFLMVFLPANRALSLDAWLRPHLRSETTPTWTLWLIRAQLVIVYFYAGIAKCNADWLRGEPMRTWLSRKVEYPVFGPLFEYEWVVYTMSWGALLFDLLVGPLLLWRPTRIYIFGVALAFHLMNLYLFSIGIFPWMMIAATALIFFPEWARLLPWPNATAALGPAVPSQRLRRLTVGLLLGYLVIQVVLPLRQFMYPGNPAWGEEGHRFSWRMLLRTKDGWVRFIVKDPERDKSWHVHPTQHMTPKKSRKMSGVPDMIVDYAHFLARESRRAGHGDVEVYARAKVALNGRHAQFLVDPKVDLTKVERSLLTAPWIVPLTQPFRYWREEEAAQERTGRQAVERRSPASRRPPAKPRRKTPTTRSPAGGIGSSGSASGESPPP